MAVQFKNMNELVEYLAVLEVRIATLENENNQLRAVHPSAGMDSHTVAKTIARALPQTSLISPGFFKRAFAVWGHFFVANLIISIIVGGAYMCFVMFVLGSFFGGAVQSGQ